MAEGARRVVLPGGFVDDRGRAHTEVDVAALTGEGEEVLLGAAPGTSSAALATAVLMHTIRRVGTLRRVTEDVVRGLLVQDREFLIVRIRELTLGPEMWVRLECPQTPCAQRMELKLMVDRLPMGGRPVRSRYFAFDESIEFRLLTGGDQEWAATGVVSDSGELGRRMLARCLRHRVTHEPIDVTTLDEPVCDAIEARLRELAPDVTPEVDAICPDCRTPFTAEVDLPYLILCELKHTTRRLEEEIHVLAWNYHWPEAEILAMSRQKRARYVQLIEDQLEKLLST